MSHYYEKLKQWIIHNPAVLLLLAIIIFLAVTVPIFPTFGNILTVLKQISPVAVVAAGVTIVYISNAKDLSAGTNMAFAAIVTNIVMGRLQGISGLILGVCAALFIGLTFGFLNGILVAFLQINPFIATLVVSLIFEGLGLVLTNGTTITGLHGVVIRLGRATVLGVSVLILFMFLIYIIGEYCLKFTRFGKCLYAVGTNNKAAYLSGVSPVKYRMLAFLICGVLASIGGIMFSIRLGSASAGMASGVMLDVTSAVLIGGASLQGGKGSLVGTFFGIFMLGLISNGFNLLNVNYNIINIAKGLIILVAVVMDSLKVRTSDRRLIRLTKHDTERINILDSP